ncbi:MAG: hypothetical protein JO233_08230 [Candidatus Eremiobacteraeota bacterium]|nr:hypothetical protein [Candidatus Eremiobacteraeota bacterium]
MQPVPQPPVALKRKRDVYRDLARILSTIFNPFLTALALFCILAHARATTPENFWWLLFLTTFFTSLGPMALIFYLYATDRISDLDMSVREEREKVFFVFVVFYLLGTVTLWLTRSPLLLIATMAGYTVSTIVVQYITRYWKISTHALGITAPLVALCLLYGVQPLPFLPLIPAVCWARVYLKAHTIGQVIAGATLAAFNVTLFFYLFHVKTLAW